MKIRKREKSLQEGSLEIMKDLPNGVLGYTRIFENEKVVILLNFSEKNNEVSNMKIQMPFSSFRKWMNVKDQTIHLGKFGGIILKTIN